MFGFGTTEILLLVGLVILFFGTKRISDLAREVGQGIKYLKGGFSDETKDK